MLDSYYLEVASDIIDALPRLRRRQRAGDDVANVGEAAASASALIDD